jgi:hypothetical protein
MQEHPWPEERDLDVGVSIPATGLQEENLGITFFG